MTHTDPYFPQMSAALNPEFMAPLLRRKLNLTSSDSDSCSIGEKRYKPGKSLVIHYRLSAQENGSTPPRLVTGRLCAPGAAHSEYKRELAKRPGLIAGALTYLPEPAMLLWSFPYDRKLEHLPALLDAASLQTQLPEKLAALGIVDQRILSVQREVLHYLAECSCMIRYGIECQHTLTANKSITLLYAKHYADTAGANVFSVMRQLDEQFADGAKALAYDAEIRTLWQSHVPGTTLVWADLNSAHGSEIIRQLGRCVAGFHACQLTTPNNFNQDHVLQGLQQTITGAAHTAAELRLAVKTAVAVLMAARPQCADYVTTPIHHDLKLNNFLVDGAALGLIDMDCVCLGNPLTDLAGLVANLYLNGLREGETAESIHALANILVAAYIENCTYRVSLPQLRWQVGAALIHEVTRRSLRQLDSQRMQHIQSYLALSRLYAANSLTEHDNDALI